MSENAPASIDDTSTFPTLTVSMTTGKIVAASGYSISSSNQIINGSGGATGWYTVVTDTSVADGVQWISAASASSTEASDTIAIGEWTDPIQFSGSGGADGINSAVAELYQLKNTDNGATPPVPTAPPKPTGSLFYTFADGLLKNSGGSTSGSGFTFWIPTASSPSATNKYLWKITAPAISTSASDEITGGATGNWSTPILAAQFGAEGATGKVGKRTFHSTMYYGTGRTNAQGAILAPGNSGSFSFSGQTFGETNTAVRDTLTTDKWSLVSPTFAPYDGSDNKLYWYACSVNVEESVDGDDNPTGSGTPTFSNVHVIHNFSGVVAFTDLSASSGSTVIHGSRITTGRISTENGNYGTDADGNYSTSGTHLDLVEGRLRSPKFYVDSSGAKFEGTISASNVAGDFKVQGSNNKIVVGADNAAGTVTINGDTQQIVINDGSNNRVVLGKL
jgi:hypothetical protein